MNINSNLRKNYKKNIRLSIFMFIVIICISYFTTINKTIQLYKIKKDFISQISVLVQKNEENKLSSEEKLIIERNLDVFSLDSLADKESVINAVQTICNKQNLILKEIPNKHIDRFDDYGIESIAFSIQGNFKNILLLIYEIEKKGGIGRVGSVKFEKIEDRKSRKKYLTAKIILQHIILTK